MRSRAPVAVYLALLLVQGCITSVHAPASASLIPMIIARERARAHEPDRREPAGARGDHGPALAGLALDWIAPRGVYAFVALTGLASAVAVSRAAEAARVDSRPRGASARKDWRVGLRFIFSSPLLLPALTLDMFAVLFAGVTALLPAIATDILHIEAVRLRHPARGAVGRRGARWR